MTQITSIPIQTLTDLTQGKQIGSKDQSKTIQNSHLILQGKEGTERISVKDYLNAKQNYPQLPQNTGIEIQLESGQTLQIPLVELSQSNLQKALQQAIPAINPQKAERTHREANPLLEQVRHGSVQTSGPEALVDFIKQNFAQLDQDGDGYLSEGEIKQAMKSTQFNAAQKSLLNRVLLNLSDLEEYSNDEWGDENDGLTLADLDLFMKASRSNQSSPALQSLTGRVSTANANAARAYQLFSKHMHLLDQDHDGYVTKEDLLKASNNNNFTAIERAWFAHLAGQVEEIEELSNDEWGDENDGITLRDMEAFVKTNTDHGIKIPDTRPEITGDLRLQVHDANGFNRPGRNDVSGSISGKLSLSRSVIDHALSKLKSQNIPYVNITNTSFNPQTKTYEISISTLVDDFKITIGIDEKTGLPYLELSDNWLPKDPLLQLIQGSIEDQLGQRREAHRSEGINTDEHLTDKVQFQRNNNRLYFIPKLENLQITTDNQYLDLEQIQLNRDNVRFAFDREGNFVLHLNKVQVKGSTGHEETTRDQPGDQAKVNIRLGIDLDENYAVKNTAIDLEASTQIHLDQKEQSQLSEYLKLHLDTEIASAFAHLIFERQGKIELNQLQAGFSFTGHDGNIDVSINQAGNICLLHSNGTESQYDINQFKTLLQQWQQELMP